MNATAPIEINNKSYDKFSLNLAISGRYLGDGSSDAQVAMRLVPTRIENGEVITADEAAIGILRGSFSEIADPAEQAAVAAIQTALQTLLVAKGL
jgi:hypothetical protein